MQTTNRMQLKVWNDLDDPYNHTDLAANWQRIDDHDHSPTWGKQIENAGLAPNCVAQTQMQDNAVGTNEIINGAVTTAKLADNSVNSAKIIDGSIQGVDIGNQQIGINHMTSAALSAIVPMGTVVPWFRPTTSVSVPQGWAICDGSTIADHDWGGGPVTIPDLRNRFVLGAATSGTGTGPTTPPAESNHPVATTGGANSRDLTHTHTVNGHSHVTNAHTHVVNSHYHGGATAGSGAFATAGAGAHNHQLRTRGVWVLNGPQAVVDEMMLQAAYVGNVSGGSGDVGVDGSDTVHAHTVPNHAHGIVAEAPGTGTQSDSGTNSVPLTTNNNSALPSDLRPGFVGLLYIMKVKNPV